ncbi:MAG: zinc ribbon domain-containing protein [Chloroflexota bacterium]|nr:zinc ribbon domain-containing protein [Chloroflexota bacterium]
MPIYEYRCNECQRRFTIFWRTFSDAQAGQTACKHCGSQNVQRLVSRIRIVRSEESRMADMADPSMLADLDENDPKSMGRFMRKMMNEMGDEAGDIGPEFDEVVDRLESGQDPEQIEKEVPGLMDGPAGGGMPGGGGMLGM